MGSAFLLRVGETLTFRQFPNADIDLRVAQATGSGGGWSKGLVSGSSVHAVAVSRLRPAQAEYAARKTAAEVIRRPFEGARKWSGFEVSWF
jgi:hypothetical protein